MVRVPQIGMSWLRAGDGKGAVRLRRFLRSPKGYLLVALLVLAALAAPATGFAAAVSTLGWAVLGAAGMELIIVRLTAGRWRVPSSALLCGLIVGMVLGPYEPWYAALGGGLLATDAKHLLRLGRGHIFNPAAFGLVAVYVLFGAGHSWWGALPDLPELLLPVLLVAGIVVAERANKLPAALSFLGGYFALLTVAAFAGDPAAVGPLFRPPDLNAALFFAFFMVTDPPTSPVPFRHQLWFGALVALVAVILFQMTAAVYYLPAAVLIGNTAFALWRQLHANSSATRSGRGRQVELGGGGRPRPTSAEPPPDQR